MLPNDNDVDLMQMIDAMAMAEAAPVSNVGTEAPSLPEEAIAPENFYENLRSKMDDLDAKKLANELLTLIKSDRDTQSAWLETANELKPYLGYILEAEGDVTSGRKFKTYDTTLSVSLDKQVAYLTSNILHESGVADYNIIGEIDDAKDELGIKKSAFMNHFVTRVDKGYYEDFKKFFTLFAWYGGVAKKIYLDSVTGMPSSRHIDPEDFIFDASCSVSTNERVTHTLHLSIRDIILKQQTGAYDPDVKLDYLTKDTIKDDPTEGLGKKANKGEANSTFTQYETHTYIDLERLLSNNGLDNKVTLPEPYIITIDSTMKDIVSIRRNWKFDDKDKNKKDFFLYYVRKFGFGNLGSGLAHDIGANCVALSKIQAMTIDAAILKNNPSGFISVRPKEQDTMQDHPPGTWKFLDTSPAPARDAFFLPPYTGADPGLIELRREILTQTQEAAAGSTMNIAEMKDNTPVGTTMIRSQEDTRLRDAISQSFCDYFRQELSMMEKLFSESLEYQEFSYGSQKFSISAEDFNSEDVVLVPMHNPANNSATHRMIRSSELMRLSREAPGMANEKELFKMNCEALQLSPQEIEKIMTPESQEQEVMPLDPITENMNLMTGKPVVTAIWQDHQAHLAAHAAISENQQMSVESRQATAAHMQEHLAQQYLVETQMHIGMELPPLDQLQDPAVQNEIALKVASVTPENQTGEASVDPVQLAAEAQQAEIAFKEMEAQLRSENDRLQREVDVFKAELASKDTEAKIESNERIAMLKANTELQKQGISYEQQQYQY